MDAGALLAGTCLMPVVVIDDEASAVPLAKTLLEAGIGAMEVTLRSGAALPAIEAIAVAVPGMLLGAGSVSRPDQLSRAADAGARFAVSPGASERLLAAAAELKLPYVPCAATASEMIRLQEHGYTLQKVFPAESLGGVAYLKALSGPLPEVRFFPTGGITLDLAADYLAFSRVACVGGSWFVPVDRLAAGDFAAIARLARTARERLHI